MTLSYDSFNNEIPAIINFILGSLDRGFPVVMNDRLLEYFSYILYLLMPASEARFFLLERVLSIVCIESSCPASAA